MNDTEVKQVVGTQLHSIYAESMLYGHNNYLPKQCDIFLVEGNRDVIK